MKRSAASWAVGSRVVEPEMRTMFWSTRKQPVEENASAAASNSAATQEYALAVRAARNDGLFNVFSDRP